MTETATSTAASFFRPAVRPGLVAFGVLSATLVGLTAFGAVSPSTAAGVVCGALFTMLVVVGGAILPNRKHFVCRGATRSPGPPPRPLG